MVTRRHLGHAKFGAAWGCGALLANPWLWAVVVVACLILLASAVLL